MAKKITINTNNPLYITGLYWVFSYSQWRGTFDTGLDWRFLR